MGPRKLLREGTLMKHKSGRKLRVFLCNDMIILTDEAVSRLYKMASNLFEKRPILCLMRLLQPIQLNQVDVKGLHGKGSFMLLFLSV